MSRRTWKYIFSLVLILAFVPLFAQQQDTIPVKKRKRADTVKISYLPTGIRFGTDVISIIRSQTSDKFKGYEVNADVDFYRYYLAVDYGTWSHRDSVSNGYYKNDGHYFRFGADVNFLLKDPDRNMIFFGLRYGRSVFNETLTYTYTDSVYGKIPKDISTVGRVGHWTEITAGLRVKIKGGFWMGYTIRLKFAPGVSGGVSSGGALAPYDIPGYGLAEQAPYWGFNYQLFWRIPLRKIK